MTIAQALERTASTLRQAGVPTPELDAELLLRHVLRWDRARLLTEGGSPLPEGARGRFDALVHERASRRPLQHLLGTQAFWKHDFLVSPDVLIPRPETELLVEEALRFLAGRARPVIVDVGTGTGCIALSLAAERPDAEVHAVDLSPAALAVAAANADRLRLRPRVAFHLGDLLSPLQALRGRVDLVASNPPYVNPADREGLAPEVRDHEPPMALFPPGEPYLAYRRLVPGAHELLRPGGGLILEVGQGMDQEVSAIALDAGFRIETVRSDLQGIPRTVVAVRERWLAWLRPTRPGWAAWAPDRAPRCALLRSFPTQGPHPAQMGGTRACAPRGSGCPRGRSEARRTARERRHDLGGHGRRRPAHSRPDKLPRRWTGFAWSGDAPSKGRCASRGPRTPRCPISAPPS